MSDENNGHSLLCAILGAIAGASIAVLAMKAIPKIKFNMQSKMEM